MLLLYAEMPKDFQGVGDGVDRVPLGQTIVGRAAEGNRNPQMG